ncbi:hypothetical protein E2C01_042056 [Portunus trituberculatus]|uniref:Uncharacterized protein n=1 Tax=Portunus trituberculatus TaxID=210409 RepID=A0A5B7FTI9_PORTR|nr:hypothetical protein [Portunus trituberculatus]
MGWYEARSVGSLQELGMGMRMENFQQVAADIAELEEGGLERGWEVGEELVWDMVGTQ